MDIVLSLSTGLGLRLLLRGLDDPLGRINPALLGLWEGVIVRNLSSATSSPDHYLAYGLRIIVDLLFTGNFSRMVIVLLWTGLGMVLSEAVNPTLHLETKRDQRNKITRSVPSHIRMYQLPAAPQQFSPKAAPPRHQSRDLGVQGEMTPQLRPSRPPSPPSFFLEGDSETNSNSPRPLQIPVQRQYVPSSFVRGDSDSNSPPLKHTLLPTPPSTSIADERDAQESNAPSRRRLSTIEELSSGEDASSIDAATRLSYIGVPGDYMGFEAGNASYAPSIATSAPLPIPNPSFRYVQANLTRNGNNGGDMTYIPSISAPLPVPIPNAGSFYIQAKLRPDTPSEADELRTPVIANQELVDIDHDELKTPTAPPIELSPLSIQHLPSGFNHKVVPEPSAGDARVPIPPPSTDIPVIPLALTSPSSALPALAIEHASEAIEDPKVDSDPLSEPESLKTETEASSVISSRAANHLYAKGELLRNQAREKERERAKLDNELKAALREARIKDAFLLRGDILDAETQAQKFHERAAKRFLLARNSSHKPLILDVHGLRAVEAIQMTEKTFREALKSGHSALKVIVGKGKHSQGGMPVLRGAVIRQMETLKIPCRVDSSNTGVLILTLPP